MPRRTLYCEEAVCQIVEKLRKSGIESDAFNGIVSKTSYFTWKKTYPEFLDRVEKAIADYRKQKRLDAEVSLEYSKTLAKAYVQRVLLGEQFSVEKIFNGRDELIEKRVKQVLPSANLLDKLLAPALKDRPEDSVYELRIGIARPAELDEDGELIDVGVDSDEEVKEGDSWPEKTLFRPYTDN